jgi:hypothetical protein
MTIRGTGSKRFNVNLGRTAFSHDLPAGAVATYTFAEK